MHSSTYAAEVLSQIASQAHQMGLPVPRQAAAQPLLATLSQAELLSLGHQQHLLGYAAANLDAALWIGIGEEEGRLRVATALDYLNRASR
jgi:hypothetical protein